MRRRDALWLLAGLILVGCRTKEEVPDNPELTYVTIEVKGMT